MYKITYGFISVYKINITYEYLHTNFTFRILHIGLICIIIQIFILLLLLFLIIINYYY